MANAIEAGPCCRTASKVDNSLLTQVDANGVAWVTLNQPRQHNVLDDSLVAALITALEHLKNAPINALVLGANGKVFSTGTSLAQFAAHQLLTVDQRLHTALQIGRLLRGIQFFPVPVLAQVAGSAYGNGIGLIAACDMAIGVPHAKFLFNEVKQGVTPCMAAPYVVAVIGQRQARRLFLSGDHITGVEAKDIGLLHQCVPLDELDDAVERALHFLLKGDRYAQNEAKQKALALAGMSEDIAIRRDQENAALVAKAALS